MQNFENLQIYQDAIELINIIYKLTKRFPEEEIYGITSQIRRAIMSVLLKPRAKEEKRKKITNSFYPLPADLYMKLLLYCKSVSTKKLLYKVNIQ